MFDSTDEPITRRNVLTTTGLLGAGLIASTGTGAAKGNGNGNAGGKETLEPVPMYFAVYAGAGDDAEAFGFPDAPTEFRGFDIDADLFDSSEIEATPGGQTLHHEFRFTPDGDIVGKPMPYVLVRGDGGRYESRGQQVVFEVDAPVQEPFDFLAPGRWRAVGEEAVILSEETSLPRYAATRVDFYRIQQGQEYELSLVYALWSPDEGEPDDPRNPHVDIPEAVLEETLGYVEGGRV